MSKTAARPTHGKPNPRSRDERAGAPLPNGSHLILALRVGGALLVAAMIAAYLWPQSRMWGVHALNYIPLAFGIPLVLVASFLLSPWSAAPLRKLHAWSARVPRLPALLFAGGAFALFYFRAVPAPLLGDGQLWLNELATIARYQEQHDTDRKFPENMERNLRKEPLEILLHDAVFQWVRPSYPQTESGPYPKNAFDALQRQSREENKRKDAAQQTYRLLSALAGALVVLLTILFVRRALAPPGRALFYWIVFGSSAMLLYFGYVENYAWASLALVACLFAGIVELGAGQRFPWRTWLCFALAVGFHYSMLVLFPAVLLATLLALRRATQPRPVRKLFATTGVLLALAGLAAYVYVQGWNGWFTILPLTAARSSDGYALLTLNHAVDLLNLLALLGLPALLLFAVRRGLASDGVSAFLLLAACSGLVYVATFNPNLGMAVDWDLLAVGLLPLIIGGAWLAASSTPPEQCAEVNAAIVACVLLVGLPYLYLNTNEPRLIHRYENLLRLDRGRSAYGWEKLGTHFERRGDANQMHRAYLEALQVEPNPRYHYKVADALLRRGSYEPAAKYAEAAARRAPQYAGLVAYIGVEVGKRGNGRLGRQLLQIASECNPADTLWASLVKNMDAALADTSVKPPAR
ncbi:hypothetical protein HZB60_09835 [candidate division KSB1 bacterium]|nr:hypothetical protein [candidate division KSB1 bacterium]